MLIQNRYRRQFSKVESGAAISKNERIRLSVESFYRAVGYNTACVVLTGRNNRQLIRKVSGRSAEDPIVHSSVYPEEKQPMSIASNRYARAGGYNIIELAMVIFTTMVLAAFALISYSGTDETRDASMVHSAQAILQTIVSQGAARADITPSEFSSSPEFSKSVLMAIQLAMSERNGGNAGVQFTLSGNEYVMKITGSQRLAKFDITNTGDVRLTDLNRFERYEVDKSDAVWKISKRH